MRAILCAVLFFIFMPFFLNAQSEIHQDDANDDSADIENAVNLLESTMAEWRIRQYKDRFLACRIVVEWTYFFRVAKPELLDKIDIEIEKRSMETTSHYAEKCVMAVNGIAEQEESSRNVQNAVIEGLVKTGLIPPENTQLLSVDQDKLLI